MYTDVKTYTSILFKFTHLKGMDIPGWPAFSDLKLSRDNQAGRSGVTDIGKQVSSPQ